MTTDRTPATHPTHDSSTRAVLRRLEIDITRRLDGLLHGNHRGLLPGHGTELGETRAYAAGDDVRMIDWNVTARLREPYIRQTIAERELRTWLVVDRSSRLDFGTVRHEKREVVLAAAASFGFVTSKTGNQIGAVLVGRGSPTVFPLRSGRQHLLHILDQIAHIPRGDGSGVTDLTTALHQLSTLARRRGLVVVISDFAVDPGWSRPMAVLSHRHDVVAVQVTDPLEFELPNLGIIDVQDPATGSTFEVNTAKASVREAYAKAAQERQARLTADIRRARADHVVLSTGSDWRADIVEFVVGRSRRASRATSPRGGAVVATNGVPA